MKVSIQLGSPASGDTRARAFIKYCLCRFHSIGIPSEWRLIQEIAKLEADAEGFHSIGIPSEWRLPFPVDAFERFIEFPFNWDPQRVETRWVEVSIPYFLFVSIQLGSPASGDILLSFLCE